MHRVFCYSSQVWVMAVVSVVVLSLSSAVTVSAATTGISVSPATLSTEVNTRVNFQVSTVKDGDPTPGTYIAVSDNGAGGSFFDSNGSCGQATPDSDNQFVITNSKNVCYSNSVAGVYSVSVQLLDAKDGNPIGEPGAVVVTVTQSAAGGGGLSGAGAVWTNIGPCGSPQNVNQYEVGQSFYGHGDKFAPNTQFTWVVKNPGENGAVLETGTITTNEDGAFCESLFTIQDKHVGGPYQFNVGASKNDNFSVISGSSSVVLGCTDAGAINRTPGANQDDGSCLYNFTITKVVPGVTASDYTAFSFTIDGGATTTFESDGTNVIAVSSSTHTVREVAVTGYTTTYDNCLDVVVTSGTAVCTITNTPVDETTYGTLIVEKKVKGVMVPEYTTFSFTIDGGATTTFESDGANEFRLPVGSYLVTETTVPGYTTWYENCQSATVVANATTTCTIINVKDSEPAPTCTVEFVSSTSDFVVEKGTFAQALSYMHPAWTAVITGATWIWGDNPVLNPATDETQTFRKQFGFVGTVTDAKLYLASDNSHTVIFNSSSVGGDASEYNFQLATQDVYDLTSLVVQGNNELSIAVRNWGASADPTANPAGLLYKLVITGQPTSDADCEVPYVPPAPEVDTYRIQGYVWHDDNRNTEWDGRFSEEQIELTENSLAGWVVHITNGSSSFSTTTDEFGYYSFDVPAGTWTITEVVQDGWTRTTQESYVVTVPEALAYGFFESIVHLIVPTAHAALLGTYGNYNFGNDLIDEVVLPSTSGGSSSGSRPRSSTLDTPLPTPQVLGEQVSVVPVGAPDTGRGGAASQTERFACSPLVLARREDGQI